MAQLDELLRHLQGAQAAPTCTSPPGSSRASACTASSQPVEGRPALADDELRELLARDRRPRRSGRSTSRTRDLDFAYGLEGVARFRANFLVQEHGAGAVFRMIPEKIVPLEELELPQAIERLAAPAAGARAGHRPDRLGQVDHARRDHRPDQPHLRASTSSRIEDPIEFVHQNKKSCSRTARSAPHTEGFGAGAARRDPPGRRRHPGRRDARPARRSRSRSPPPRWACSCSAPCTPTAPPRPSTASIDAFPADEQAQIRTIARRVARRRSSSQLLLPHRRRQGPRAPRTRSCSRRRACRTSSARATRRMLHSIIQAGKAAACSSWTTRCSSWRRRRRSTRHDAYMKATEKARFEPLLPKE